MSGLELVIIISLPILFLASEFLLNRLAGGSERTKADSEES